MRAALSHVGPTMVEPHGCGGATTRPHAAHPTSDQPGPSRMDAAPAAQPRGLPETCSRTPSTRAGAGRATSGPQSDRRTPHRGARTMRAALSHVGPTMVEPHGCGGATRRAHAAQPLAHQASAATCLNRSSSSAPLSPAGSNPARAYQSECRPGGPYGALKRRFGGAGFAGPTKSGWADLNRRPPDPQSGALPSCATARRLAECSRRCVNPSPWGSRDFLGAMESSSSKPPRRRPRDVSLSPSED